MAGLAVADQRYNVDQAVTVGVDGGDMALTASQHPSAFAGWLNAMDFAIGPQLQLAIAGSPSDARFGELLSRFNSEYIPNLIVAGGEPGATAQRHLISRMIVEVEIHFSKSTRRR